MVPAPLRPDRRPVLVKVKPSLVVPVAKAAPVGLTLPDVPSAMILPLVTTNAVVTVPWHIGPPTITAAHEPS